MRKGSYFTGIWTGVAKVQGKFGMAVGGLLCGSLAREPQFDCITLFDFPLRSCLQGLEKLSKDSGLT